MRESQESGMSYYVPDQAAIPKGLSFTRQLVSGWPQFNSLLSLNYQQSQRDLALQVPANFVTSAGIALTPYAILQSSKETSVLRS